MSQRPRTSKPRGVCKYYVSRLGCLNGDACKFLHGESETFSPLDKSKVCRYYAAGFCKHGELCWFRHEGSTSATSAARGSQDNAQSPSAQQDEDDDQCCICQEKPVTYGLLENCSHICCLKCLRDWRDPAGKSLDIIGSGNTKKCPYCRTSSRFITPSSVFYPSQDPRKEAAIEHYKSSMARVPCKYFQRSQPGRRNCPFGRDCFYQHKESDGTDYVFPFGADYYMNRTRRQTRNIDPFGEHWPFIRADADPADVMRTLSEIRTRLQSLSLISSSNFEDSDNDEHPLSRLVEDVLSSLESTIASSSEEGHPPRSPLRLPGLSNDNPSSRPSPLPLTRSFMETIETIDSISMAHEAGTSARARREHFRHNLSSPWVAAERIYPASDSEDSEETEVLSSVANVFDDASSPRTTPSSPHSVRLFLPSAQPSFVLTVDSDDESASNSSNGFSEPGLSTSDSSTTPSLSPILSEDNGVLSPSPNSPACESATPISDNWQLIDPSHSLHAESDPGLSATNIMEIQNEDASNAAIRNATEQRKERRRTKSAPIGGPRNSTSDRGSGWRNSSQGFVTDGRGRVVATDEGFVGDRLSLCFWHHEPESISTDSETVDLSSQ